ncbi:MAG: hypothetical protein RLZZ361_864, partial [Cyanobacteriota bacterium]
FVRDYSRARLEDKEFCDSIKMIDEIVGQALGVGDIVYEYTPKSR